MTQILFSFFTWNFKSNIIDKIKFNLNKNKKLTIVIPKSLLYLGEFMINNFKKLMIIAPHPDDEILGCGGLISKFCSYPNTKIEIIIVGGHLPPLYKKRRF